MDSLVLFAGVADTGFLALLERLALQVLAGEDRSFYED
jgi:hypothetical protein